MTQVWAFSQFKVFFIIYKVRYFKDGSDRLNLQQWFSRILKLILLHVIELQRGAFWCQLSIRKQNAVSIFIFLCPAHCVIKSEWLWPFPLGFFPSPASLCDPIRRMIHTARSLGFHRIQSHVVRCTYHTGRAKDIRKYGCSVLCFVCAETYIFSLLCSMYEDMRAWVSPWTLFHSSSTKCFH